MKRKSTTTQKRIHEHNHNPFNDDFSPVDKITDYHHIRQNSSNEVKFDSVRKSKSIEPNQRPRSIKLFLFDKIPPMSTTYSISSKSPTATPRSTISKPEKNRKQR